MADGSRLDLTVVIPAFNEAVRLPPTLDRLGDELDLTRTEVVVVDDGSTDDTNAIAHERTRAMPHATVIGQASNRGKGAAVRTGMAAASGRRALFMDADLATDLSCVPLMTAALENAEVAVGSRELPDSDAPNTLGRSLMRRGWNRIIRASSNLDLDDTQCGFKAFRTDAAKLLFRLSTIDRYAFDVEILSLAQRLDMRIVEVPVRWRAVEGSKVRPVVDSLSMLRDLRRATKVSPRLRVPAIVLDGTASPAALPSDVLLGRLDDDELALFPAWPRDRVEGAARDLSREGPPPRVIEIEAAELLDRLDLSRS